MLLDGSQCCRGPGAVTGCVACKASPVPGTGAGEGLQGHRPNPERRLRPHGAGRAQPQPAGREARALRAEWGVCRTSPCDA